MAASEYHHGEMDIHDQQATWDGFIKGTTWGSLILALMLGHALMTVALGLHWAVSLGLMTLVGIGSGIVLNLGGRWYATLVILLFTGLFIQAMIWLFGVLI
nr:aa3-type cytochrome c oxidase subunit IV [uncultured Hyphomonas sp.]